MNNETTITSADIRFQNKKVLLVYYVLASIIIVIGAIPEHIDSLLGKVTHYRLFFLQVCQKIEYNDNTKNMYNKDMEITWDTSKMIISITLFCILVFIPALKYVSNMHRAKHYSLRLTSRSLEGAISRLMSSDRIQLPLDKIDSIMILNKLSDKIIGGQTISIRSASGILIFPWVHNADDFIDSVKKEIDKHEHNSQKRIINTSTENAASNQSANDKANDIRELKALLDEGLITQEEFENKRKIILNSF